MTVAVVVLMAVAAAVAGPQREDVQVLKLATGEALVFPFQGGIPKPSESAWAFCRGAGPAFTPDEKGIRLSWAVDLRSKGSALRDVSSVKMQEVSGKEAVTLFTGAPKATKDGLMILAPGELSPARRIRGCTPSIGPSWSFAWRWSGPARSRTCFSSRC